MDLSSKVAGSGTIRFECGFLVESCDINKAWLLWMCSITFSWACYLMNLYAVGCMFQAVRRLKLSPLNADEVACIEEVGHTPSVGCQRVIHCMMLRRWWFELFTPMQIVLMWSLKYSGCIFGGIVPIIFWLLPMYTNDYFRRLRCTSMTGSKCVVIAYHIGTQLHFLGNGGLPSALKNLLCTTERSVGFRTHESARVLLVHLKFAHLWYSPRT